ncbi:transglutaminase-like domain-containing protein [Actinokineospora sp. 24-640]
MSTRLLRVGCAFEYTAEVPTPAVFHVQPDDGVLSERWAIEPAAPSRRYRDIYQNQCLRTVLPEGSSSVRFDALVEVPDAPEDVDEGAVELPADKLPDEVLHYTLPSRYCLPDVLGDEAWSRFGGLQPGYQRVRTICAYVHEHLSFGYGSSTALSTAVDVNTAGAGVCRDYAHLAISFCRALNIPARYVFGYLPSLGAAPADEVPDFAAWMEVWLGDRWWTFDPRNNTRRTGRVVIGHGRDAADVAMVTTFGGPVLDSMTVHAEEAPDPKWPKG